MCFEDDIVALGLSFHVLDGSLGLSFHALDGSLIGIAASSDLVDNVLGKKTVNAKVVQLLPHIGGNQHRSLLHDLDDSLLQVGNTVQQA
jgi:hypothetical protein